MDNLDIKGKDIIIISFHSNSSWWSYVRTNKIVRKFEKKGFTYDDSSNLILDKNGFTSNLIFTKNNP